MGATIYYDGQCPFCARYTALLELRQAVGDVRLVDLREDVAARSELEQAGFDVDEGMVFEINGERFHGADAINRMALLSSGASWFNRLNAWLFKSPRVSRAAYPFLRAGRNAVLFALARGRMRENHPDQMSMFAIFSHAFGIFGFIDLLYHLYRGHPTPAIWATGVLGAYLALRPRSPRIFALLAVAMLANGLIRMPASSNHAMLLNVTLAAMAAAAVYIWLRGRDWSCFMHSFAPVGRCLLVVMYVFGVFHKINTDFLDPAISCASALWDAMPAPLSQVDAAWMRYSAIYGTLIGEAAILVGLLFHRTRHLSIVAGIAFHSLLALSGYGFYPAFSTLTISLHLLFLSPGAARRIVNAPAWKTLQARVHGPGIVGALLWMLLLGLLSLNGSSPPVGLLWLPWSIWLACLIARHGREQANESSIGPPLYSKTWALNALSLAFFISCFAPYLGLKNAQSMNMFSNLVHEGGESNHLVLGNMPRPFGYLDDLVTPVQASGAPAIAAAIHLEKQLTFYALLDQLDRNPDAKATFVRNGQTYIDQSADTLSGEIERQLHPRWFRALFHFKSVGPLSRRTCDDR